MKMLSFAIKLVKCNGCLQNANRKSQIAIQLQKPTIHYQAAALQIDHQENINNDALRRED